MPVFGLSIDPIYGRCFIAVDPREDPLDESWDWASFDGLMFATTDEVLADGQLA